MSRYPRGISIGYYHVYNRGVDKSDIYFSRDDRTKFLELLGHYTADHGIRLHGYCLMINHYHLFLRSTHSRLDAFMRIVQGRYSRFLRSVYGRRGYLFQGRYQSRRLEDTTEALRLLRYIHRNPCEIGERFDAYEWSSYRSYLRLKDRPSWLNCDFFLELFGGSSHVSKRNFEVFHDEVPVT